MKIVNLDKGEAYELQPDVKLEIDRTNPFLNEYGEQSVPMDMPASDRNRRLFGYPDKITSYHKMERINVSITDGEYYMACKQAVLSSKYKDNISTSFYMNEGAFYTNMKKVNLKDIFTGDYEFVKDASGNVIDAIDNGISFCRTLRTDSNPYYSIFPVMIENDGGNSTGFKYKWINAFGTIKGDIFTINQESGADFYNAISRPDYISGSTISINKGYYISPFIRANYVLKIIFRHFGYELQESFFDRTEPFSKMVFCNNVIDSLINGKIRNAHLVPDVLCSDIINLYRKKFHCEFIPDEIEHTVSIVMFDDILDSVAETDLTPYLAAEPDVELKSEDDYKKVVLSPSDTVGENEAENSYDDILKFAEAYPAATFNKYDGCFYRIGYKNQTKITDKVAECSMKYDVGDDTEGESIDIPECMPELRWQKWNISDSSSSDQIRLLYIGAYQTLNSKLVTTSSSDSSTSTSSNTLKSMLAIPFMASGTGILGTISNYDYTDSTVPKMYDYALFYYGEDGIFQKFYSRYDLLLRNSMHKVTAKLLLNQTIKRTLSSYKKVLIRNAELIFNMFKYTLGGKDEPVDSELFTLHLYDPVVESSSLSDILAYGNTGYHWTIHEESVDAGIFGTTDGPSEPDNFKSELTVVYPPVANSSYVGQQLFEQTYGLYGEHYSGEQGSQDEMFQYWYSRIYFTCDAD